ncbi:MAG: pilus assembly protein PilP [Betaproteobacteria bacterium]|nr:pilus assembly protein PilP [Betaproteobacteria bacterium]
MRFTLAFLWLVLLVAACDQDQHRNLRRELDELTKDLRGKVEPLQPLKPYEPVPYQAEGEVDPFRPDRVNVAKVAPAPVLGRTPNLDRPKEPLESFSLESIQMVGAIVRPNQDTYGLVKAGPNLYRVKKGNYMGQNYGVITGIEETQINLKELVQDSGGEWVERVGALMLQEVGKK